MEVAVGFSGHNCKTGQIKKYMSKDDDQDPCLEATEMQDCNIKQSKNLTAQIEFLDSFNVRILLEGRF